MSKKIIPIILVFAIVLSVLAVPVAATEGTTVSSTGSFWQMVANSNSDFMQFLIGTLSNSALGSGTVCPDSPDAKHYGSPIGAGRNSRVVLCRCKYCGETFEVDDSVVQDAYEDYIADFDSDSASYGEGYVDFSVSNLTSYSLDGTNYSRYSNYEDTFFFHAVYALANATGVRTTSSGAVYWTYFDNLGSFFKNLGIQDKVFVCAIGSYSPYYLFGYYWNEYGRLCLGRFENPFSIPSADTLGVYDLSDLKLLSNCGSDRLYYSYSLARTDPSYLNTASYLFNFNGSFYIRANYSYDYFPQYISIFSKSSSETNFGAKTSVELQSVFPSIISYPYVQSDGSTVQYSSFYFPTKTQTSVKASKEYLVHGPAGTDSSSRPGSITGDYGVIGDNNTITNIGSQVIINEADLIYTNPATGDTQTIESWQYAYGSRKYTIVTGDGNTVTITYGDENITINEGDTVYNIYYMVDVPDETPPCSHSYTHTVLAYPTCKVTGLEQYKCELCGHSYQAATPATGHTWKILQDVNTQYDDTGALIQEGYTIYECEICGEQYKSTDGSAPPTVNNGGSSGSGGSFGDSSGGFLGGIFDKIGELLGTLGGGIVDAIGSFVGFILDSLISLAQMLVDKGLKVIDLILSFFERIPGLFGAFPAFLAAVFPFIPEDMLLIIEFGLAAVVFIGILRWLRK